MLYDDRKMLKWQGLILPEHAEQLREENIKKKQVMLDEQEKDRFDRIVNISIHFEKEIVFNMDTFGEPYFEVKGVVQSFTRTGRKKGFLSLKGSSSVFWVDEIVSITLVER
ncbi:hypothetical protein [Domibacillus epiphyticus]|uniref:YolD-like family protein n=1 Tax=Domibacillus epiphyticus TaxID=1714355 RepID=A0A1V2AA41_9BACI|nr:hypothetical protein [Domibacillus epiphyticus]OMP67865.1 hypothetical protein BTO28_05100 [Domibacillus epiphyticus]